MIAHSVENFINEKQNLMLFFFHCVFDFITVKKVFLIVFKNFQKGNKNPVTYLHGRPIMQGAYQIFI